MSADGAASSSSGFRGHFGNALGCTMLDDNLRLLSDFLYAHSSTGQSDIEVEGKLGLLFSKKRDARIHMDGVRGLVCIAADEVDASFAAEVDVNMFRHINENLLQRRFKEEQQKARAEGRTPMWTYQHTVTTDKFHTVGNDRVRVSYDPAGNVSECIVKEKLQHLDFWNGKPKCIDFRISANRERRVDLPKTECDQIRKKDRLSYRFDLYAIELTKVDLFNDVKNGEPANERPSNTSFEVEIELKEMAFLKQEAMKVKNGQPNEFVRIATSFLENLRTFAQYALPHQLPPGWKPLIAAPVSNAAAAAATKKRTREDEPPPNAKEGYGKAWS